MSHAYQRILALFSHRRLLLSLLKHKIQVQYTNSYLGLLWVGIEPLFLVATLTFVFTVINQNPSSPIFYYIGLLLFNLFKQSITTGSKSIIENAGIVKKKKFPRELLVLSTWGSFFIEFLLSCVAFLLVVFFCDISVTIHWLALIPLLVIFSINCINVMLIVSAINVYIRDIGLAMPMFANVLFWISPIVFNFPYEGEFRILYFINPLVGLIQNVREVILYSQWPTWLFTLPGLFSAILGCTISMIIFLKLEKNFADEL